MPRQNMGLTRVSFYAQPEVMSALAKLAKFNGVPYSSLLREAVAQYVHRELVMATAEIRAKIPVPAPLTGVSDDD